MGQFDDPNVIALEGVVVKGKYIRVGILVYCKANFIDIYDDINKRYIWAGFLFYAHFTLPWMLKKTEC